MAPRVKRVEEWGRGVKVIVDEAVGHCHKGDTVNTMRRRLQGHVFDCGEGKGVSWGADDWGTALRPRGDGLGKAVLHSFEERAQMVERGELDPASEVAEDKPDIEEEEDEEGCNLVEAAAVSVEDESDDEPCADEVGKCVAEGGEQQADGNDAEAAIARVNGVKHSDYGPRKDTGKGYGDGVPSLRFQHCAYGGALYPKRRHCAYRRRRRRAARAEVASEKGGRSGYEQGTDAQWGSSGRRCTIELPEADPSRGRNATTRWTDVEMQDGLLRAGGMKAQL